MADRTAGGVHIALCCLAGLALGGTAHAQSDAAILRHLRQRFATCEVTSLRVAYRGALPGESRPVAVATYNVESCGGSNFWQSDFGAFVEDGGRVRELPHPRPRRQQRFPDVVERVSVVAGRIAVQSKAYAGGDPHCCPSLTRRQHYVVRDGRLVPAR